MKKYNSNELPNAGDLEVHGNTAEEVAKALYHVKQHAINEEDYIMLKEALGLE